MPEQIVARIRGVEAARPFTLSATPLLDCQAECIMEVAMAKLFATEVAAEVTERAMRAFQGPASEIEIRRREVIPRFARGAQSR
jgi:alkylation response protein AidB-like acyl-CoA dehydrogenase